MHFSGGGVEIADWEILNQRIEGKLQTQWKYPVKVTAAFPVENESEYIQKSILVTPGQDKFWIEFPDQ